MCQALNSSDTAKVKRSKVKVTRSNEIVHKYKIYSENVIG